MDAADLPDIRVAVVGDDNVISALEYSLPGKDIIKGNVYVAVVKRVEPALQAAFIEYEDGKSGFLPFNEIHPDYYNKSSTFALKLVDIKPVSNINIDLGESISNESDNSSRAESVNTVIDIEKLRQSVSEECNETKDEGLDDENSQESIPKKDELVEENRIQDVLQKGQIILVQAVKEERGNKCPSFSTYLSLVGRYSILFPNRPDNSGVSKKIVHCQYRKQVKRLIESFLEHLPGGSVIIRTAANKKSTDEIKSDYIYLLNKWNWICKLANSSKKCGLINVEENILQRVCRDMINDNTSKVLVEGEETYKNLIKIAEDIIPNLVKKISLYKEKTPIFTKFKLEEQVSQLYQPIIDLKSGGSLVINPAEGMTLIDINSGKSNAYGSLRDTALQTNVEATVEIAKQVRLREISGLIVIDFIDMKEVEDNTLIKNLLEKSFLDDDAKVQIGSISQFGLLEMSRQRVRSSFLELTSKMCPTCLGRGVLRNEDVNDALIIRMIKSEISTYTGGRINIVRVYCGNSAIVSILNNKRAEISNLEKKHGLKIEFQHEEGEQIDQFSIEIVSTDDINRGYDKFIANH